MKYRKILLTGASGSLGKQLIYEFAKSGVKPVVQVRAGSDTTFIDSLGLEKRFTDIRDRAGLEKLVSGIEGIVHTAAWVNFRQDRLTQFVGVNTFGAIELYRAAAKAGVRRFVHVSTVAAIGAAPRGASDGVQQEDRLVGENFQFNLGHLSIPYILTKHEADVELLELSKEFDTELVIVNPSIIVAPSRTGDDRGKALKAFSRKLMPSFPNRVNLVDTRDVVPAIIAALERGRAGEKYILAGDNISIGELLLAVSAIFGKSPHLIRLPLALLSLAAHLNVIYSRLVGRRKISFYPDLVKMMDYDWVYSSDKAQKELGFNPRSVHDTLRDLLTNNFTDTHMKPLSADM
jgi:dihydroflavonol-4-reductase